MEFDEFRGGISIYDFCFSYITYADNKTFFLKSYQPPIKLVESFQIIVSYWSLNLNLLKCEIAS